MEGSSAKMNHTLPDAREPADHSQWDSLKIPVSVQQGASAVMGWAPKNAGKPSGDTPRGPPGPSMATNGPPYASITIHGHPGSVNSELYPLKGYNSELTSGRQLTPNYIPIRVNNTSYIFCR